MSEGLIGLLKNIQQMADKAESIEVFREMLKVVVMGIEAIDKNLPKS